MYQNHNNSGLGFWTAIASVAASAIANKKAKDARAKARAKEKKLRLAEEKKQAEQAALTKKSPTLPGATGYLPYIVAGGAVIVAVTAMMRKN